LPAFSLAQLNDNRITGPLPDAWAASRVRAGCCLLALSCTHIYVTWPSASHRPVTAACTTCHFLKLHVPHPCLLPSCLQPQLLSLANNSLSGAAFPPAWQRPGAMPDLATLVLSGNAGLAGTLPANLSWPNLKTL
jgi:hypothetical protein